MTNRPANKEKPRETWAAVKKEAQYAYKEGMLDPTKLAKCRSMSVYMYMN